MPSGLKKFSSIDAFRGWAILMVLAVHINQFVIPPSMHLRSLLNHGARGVQLFYVLSAFSLVYRYYVRMEHGRFFMKDYFLRRLFRIAPLFWVALCFYLWFNGTGPNYYAPNGVGPVQIATNFLFINAWFPSTISAIIPVGWSVAIEMMFYLLLPLIFLYVRNLKQAISWLLVSMVFAWAFGRLAMKFFILYLPPEWQQIDYNFAWLLSLPAQLPVFMTGVVFYFVYRALAQIEDNKIRETLGLSFVFFGSIFLLAMVHFSFDSKLIPEFVLYGFIWGFFMIGCLVRPVRLLDNKLTRFFGKISFSAYLWHLPILQSVMAFCRSHGYTPPQHNYVFYIAYIGLVAVIGAVAYASYRLIELPGIRLGERVIARLKKPVPVEIAPPIFVSAP